MTLIRNLAHQQQNIRKPAELRNRQRCSDIKNSWNCTHRSDLKKLPKGHNCEVLVLTRLEGKYVSANESLTETGHAFGMPSIPTGYAARNVR